MDYEDDESEYDESKYADDYPDRDVAEPDEPPRYSFTQEVRDLFGVSLVTDVVVEHHTDDCRYSTERIPAHRCSCSTVSYYYLGLRPIPEEGIEKVRITPTFTELTFLEMYCEQNISRFRMQASKRSANA
jgi:hypothetical protein